MHSSTAAIFATSAPRASRVPSASLRRMQTMISLCTLPRSPIPRAIVIDAACASLFAPAHLALARVRVQSGAPSIFVPYCSIAILRLAR